MARELIEEEGDGRSRCVVAGEKQRHDVVSELAVGEADAAVVTGIEQEAEDVVAALATRSASTDLAIDEGVEARARVM